MFSFRDRLYLIEKHKHASRIIRETLRKPNREQRRTTTRMQNLVSSIGCNAYGFLFVSGEQTNFGNYQ